MHKKIIHFIFNLSRGGAETMMVRVIKELPEYEHVVVTLFPGNNFGEELACKKWICLNINSLLALPLAFFKFRKLVKAEKPDIIHTHLFWPTFIARFAVPKRIPLITTIHAFIATSGEYKHWYIRFLDKLSYKFRKSIIIVVAKGALDEYFSFLNLEPYKAYALYTFVDVERFNVDKIAAEKSNSAFKLVAVGALRLQKNYPYIINAMALIKDKNIELDIYGTGNLQTELQQQIDSTGAKVFLKGEVNNIEAIIPQYDLFVMSSTYEGFSLGILEAMAMRMPLLLSDIVSFKEQCENNAWYFSLADVQDAASQIVALSSADKNTLLQKAEAGRKRAINNFTLAHHISGLRKIYDEALSNTD
ncbi:MAG: glycosyltransferase [Chitinophagaceae bacterium]|nr:glycosyltransferase [Chitinophagaceae bacterium]MBL0198937.1 glycosyltransferase [Chitinophagaceae bacterium]